MPANSGATLAGVPPFPRCIDDSAHAFEDRAQTTTSSTFAWSCRLQPAGMLLSTASSPCGTSVHSEPALRSVAVRCRPANVAWGDRYARGGFGALGAPRGAYLETTYTSEGCSARCAASHSGGGSPSQLRSRFQIPVRWSYLYTFMASSLRPRSQE